MSRAAHIAVGNVYARFVAAESEILFFIAMRKDRMFADSAVHDARIMTKCKSFSYAQDIAPKHLAAGRRKQPAFSRSNPVQ